MEGMFVGKFWEDGLSKTAFGWGRDVLLFMKEPEYMIIMFCLFSIIVLILFFVDIWLFRKKSCDQKIKELSIIKLIAYPKVAKPILFDILNTVFLYIIFGLIGGILIKIVYKIFPTKKE